MTTAAARIQRKVGASSTATKAMRTNVVDCTGHLSNDVTLVGSAPSFGLVVSGKIRESSRDDSGNSSSSSSLEQLEQPACRDSSVAVKVDMKATVEAAIVDANTSSSSASEASSIDRANTWTDENLYGQDRLWQSVDFISEPEKERLFPAGYEDDEVERHVPLHKTVCCALCRKKQQRQEKLRLQQAQELPRWTTSSPTSQNSLLYSPANEHLSADTVDSGVNHSTFSVDDVEISSTSSLGHSSLPNNASPPAGTNPDEEFDVAVNSAECHHGQSTEPSSLRQRHPLHPDSVPAERRSSGGVSRSGSGGSEKGQMRPFSSPQLNRFGADNRQLLTAKDEKQLAVFAAKKRQQREQEVRRELNHHQQQSQERLQQQQQNQQNRRSGANDNMKMASSPKSSPGDKGRLSLVRSSSAGSSRRTMSTYDVIVDDTSPTASSYSTRRSVQRSTSSLTCQGHGANCGCGRNHDIEPAIRSKPSSTIRCRNQDNSALSSPTSDCPCARCAARYGAATLERKHDQSQLYQAEERRNQMERRLEEQRQKIDDLVSQLQDKQEEEQRRLNEIKQQRLSQLAEKARTNDDHARTTVENVKEMERRQEEELQRLQEALEANLSAAELRVKARREEEMNQLKAELQSKIEKSKRKQARMEEELKQWQDSIIRYREMQERNARALAQAQIDSRRSVAAKEREIRERQQKDNLLRMQEQEREWRASVEASIRLKEERRKSLLKEREAQKKQAHEMAAISRQMRDELRLNSSLSDFNRYV